MIAMEKLKKILEAAIFAAGEPVTVERLMKIFSEEELVDVNQIKQALAALKECHSDGVYHLKEVASGFRFQVNKEYSPWLIKLWEEKPPKYSKAVLETLALVAYRQPTTRPEVEEIRGVSSSSHIFKTLLEREWIRVVGHKDVPGKPSLFATTKQFLDYFNLQSLEDLPTLAQVMDLDKVAKEFGEQLELSVSDKGLLNTEAVKDGLKREDTSEEIEIGDDEHAIDAQANHVTGTEDNNDLPVRTTSALTFAALTENFAHQTAMERTDIMDEDQPLEENEAFVEDDEK